MIEVAFQTSGTTGEPKKIVHSLEAMEENARAFNKLVFLRSDTVMYHCLPRTHMAGFLNTILCPVLAGGRVVFGPTFSPQSALTFWEKPVVAHCNVMWITPTIASALIRLVRDKELARHNAGGFDQIFCGTAPLSDTIRSQWKEAFGIPLQESYGTSELMLISAQTKTDAWAGEKNCGRLIDNTAVLIHQDGEIMVSRDNGSEYSVTGDIGSFENSFLHIFGRIKDIIIKGGENVSPRLIEDTIMEMVSISDVAVLGKPHEFWGETVSAFVVRRYDSVTYEGILGHCLKTLPKSHWPDEIVFIDAMPRTETGKIRKEVLREKLVSPEM